MKWMIVVVRYRTGGHVLNFMMLKRLDDSSSHLTNSLRTVPCTVNQSLRIEETSNR